MAEGPFSAPASPNDKRLCRLVGTGIVVQSAGVQRSPFPFTPLTAIIPCLSRMDLCSHRQGNERQLHSSGSSPPLEGRRRVKETTGVAMKKWDRRRSEGKNNTLGADWEAVAVALKSPPSALSRQSRKICWILVTPCDAGDAGCNS